MGERIGPKMGFQQLTEVRSLSEENKTPNQMINSSPRSKFLGELVISSGV